MAGNDDDFDGDPFGKPEQWKRLNRVIHEWDTHREHVKAIATVINAAIIVKKAMPYGIALGLILIAVYHRNAFLGAGG